MVMVLVCAVVVKLDAAAVYDVCIDNDSATVDSGGKA